MREIRWTRAAYSEPPRIEESDGRFRCIANVESWSGTADELLAPAYEMVENLGGALEVRVDAYLTWVDGVASVVDGIDHLRELMKPADLRRIEILRIECVNLTQNASVVIVVKLSVPGIQILVSSISKVQALGVAELVFQKSMIGYVDRLGGWRAIALMGSNVVPMIFISAVLSTAGVSSYIRLIAGSVMILGVMASFLWSYPRLLVSVGVELLESLPERGRMRLFLFLKSAYLHPNVRIFLSVLGALLLGVIGNKLSDIIPWPK